jgi:hypothetical protein
MSVGEEALRVNDQLAIAAPGHDRLNGVRRLALQGTAWGNDGNAHGACLWLQTRSIRNGAPQLGSA